MGKGNHLWQGFVEVEDVGNRLVNCTAFFPGQWGNIAKGPDVAYLYDPGLL